MIHKRVRRSLADEIKSGIFYLHLGFSIVIIFTGVAYIFTFASSSQFGNRVRQAQLELSELRDRQDYLSIEALEAQTQNEQSILDPESADVRVSVEPQYLDSRLDRLTQVPDKY